MFLQYLWFVMIFLSMVSAMLTGQGKAVLPAALSGAGKAVNLSLQLLAGYLFFCGLMNIVKNLSVQQSLSRRLRPMLTRLMGDLRDEETLDAVTLNLSANLLGLGNAATPYGIKASQLLSERSQNRSALYMLLIINATSITLLPTTVLTLRTAAGSVQPSAILLPSLLATLASTATGVGLGLLCQRFSEARHAA